MHCHDASCFVHAFTLFRSMRWYTYHACLCHSLAFYASLHTCLHVHTWVLLASVSSILQHNKAIDIRSKPTLVPRGHHLFVCPFACLSSFLFACSLAFLFLCLPCLSHLFALCLLICSFHPFLPLLDCWFLVFVFACTHIEQGHIELGHDLPGASKEGTGTSMSI